MKEQIEKEDRTVENIFSNYFEFLQENMDIWVCYKEEGTVFCKVDEIKVDINIIKYTN